MSASKVPSFLERVTDTLAQAGWQDPPEREQFEIRFELLPFPRSFVESAQLKQNATASIRLDFPLPFGPTTQINGCPSSEIGNGDISKTPEYDLKSSIRRLLRI
jgi:hypothetical protein